MRGMAVVERRPVKTSVNTMSGTRATLTLRLSPAAGGVENGSLLRKSASFARAFFQSPACKMYYLPNLTPTKRKRTNDGLKITNVEICAHLALYQKFAQGRDVADELLQKLRDSELTLEGPSPTPSPHNTPVS